MWLRNERTARILVAYVRNTQRSEQSSGECAADYHDDGWRFVFWKINHFVSQTLAMYPIVILAYALPIANMMNQPPHGASYSCKRQILSMQQTSRFEFQQRDRMTLTLTGLLETRGSEHLKYAIQGDTFQYTLPIYIRDRLRQLHSNIVSAWYDATSDTVRLRVKPSIFPSVVLVHVRDRWPYKKK